MRIGSVRLYRSAEGAGPWLELPTVLTRPIRSELIAQQYDQIVKYATALHLGTAESESILRRFTRGPKHPHLPGARGARRSGADEFWEPGAGPTCLHAVEAIVERESVFEDFYRAERTTILRAVVYALEDADLGAEATDEA